MTTQEINDFKKELNEIIEKINKAIDITKRKRLCEELKTKISEVIKDEGDIIYQDEEKHWVYNDYLNWDCNCGLAYMNESIDVYALSDYFKETGKEITKENIIEAINNNEERSEYQYDYIDENAFIKEESKNILNDIETLIIGQDENDKIVDQLKNEILEIQKEEINEPER